MPAYISHAIMGNELYNNLNEYNNLIKAPISINELKGYSLGADLACLSKKLLFDPHNSHTQDFFIKMINYIKDNKLQENGHVIALLYGHIAHYFFDINVHPLVFYIELGCKKVGIIPNHHLVEGYYDSYLADKIMNCDVMGIKASFFNQIELNISEVRELLNTIYGEIYGDKNIIYEYKKVLMIFTALEKVIKSGLISKEYLIKISKFNEFMEINNLSFNELVNANNNIYTNPLTGARHNESLLSLFNKSLDMCIEAIKDVNESLYENKSLSNLEKCFTNLSYDTGVSCEFGKKRFM